jgi:dTDP-4-amino-4,6-dideoxygalactose transaminase
VGWPRIRLWPALPPRVYLRRPSTHLPFPLGELGCLLFARARHGLWYGIQDLGLGPGDEILAPAYHCGSEIEVLVRANLRCRFYDATETLEPDEGELESLLGPRTRALFLIHYFGFPQNAVRWRAWCDKHGLMLIEDCAQAFLASFENRPLGSWGDIAIYSMYKTFPLPDGAALLAGSPHRTQHPASLGLSRLLRRHTAWLMSRSSHLDRLLARFEDPEEEDFTLGDPESRPFRVTDFLLRRVVDAEAAVSRRENYRVLLNALHAASPPVFASLPDGACPLIFPVETAEVDRLVGRLEEEGISARRFWPLSHPALPVEQFPRATAWHRRFVALPVHQELRASDLERLVGVTSKIVL